ncbi:MBL fold metallo-hydrolase [Patescibacteria group bacterium]
MKLKFLGAAGTVTGSGYILSNDSGESIMVDLGMFQGPPEIHNLNQTPLDAEVADVSGVLLTHAHMDHSGRLPMLVSKGYKGDIYMTEPTKDLISYALLDSARIQNKENPETALYIEKDVKSIFRQFKTIPYEKPFQIGSFKVRYYDAGHIIGSAMIEIQTDGKTIIFSGDLGNSPEPLVKPTKLVKFANIVVMESTYGDRLHPVGDPNEVVKNEIEAIKSSGGTLMIPAFSINRTQEILNIFNHIKPSIPVFLDSPMADYATDVYDKFKFLMNSEIKNDYQTEDGPFIFPELHVIRNHSDKKILKRTKGPKVIIAGSGMMTGGRILSHAIKLLPNSSTRLLIVGYQGEGTIGRSLQEGEKNIRIYGRDIKVKATITDCQLMSSHADCDQLIKWLSHIKGVEKLILTHGEEAPRKNLSEKIQTDLNITDITLPELNQEITI